jgi:hypothetical protein
MTLTPRDMKQLAQMGAQARLAQLDREREALLRSFPGLRVAGQPAKPRARRRMSTAARRRISLAMKKRWAERRK